MDRNGTFKPQLNVTKPQIELIAFILCFKNNSSLSSERTRKPRNANLPKTQKFLKIQDTKFTLLILKIHLFYSKSNLSSEFSFEIEFFHSSFENSPFLIYRSLIAHFLFENGPLNCKIDLKRVIFKRFHVEYGRFHVFG